MTHGMQDAEREQRLITHDQWAEYDAAAEWCAKHGFKGDVGDPLPNLMSKETVELINADPEAFADRVRLTAYSLAMRKGRTQFPHRHFGDRALEPESDMERDRR
jgi:hypothetical protein